MKYKYDKESDILSVFLSDKPFSYAREVGDVIVHYDKNENPVYLEFLNANIFLKKATSALPLESQLEILKVLQTSQKKTSKFA